MLTAAASLLDASRRSVLHQQHKQQQEVQSVQVLHALRHRPIWQGVCRRSCSLPAIC
jgi:hypothetical protein